MLAKVMGCLEYITSRPHETQDALKSYKKQQHPDSRRMAREVIKALRARIQSGHMDDPDDDEAIVDQLAGDYTDEDDEYVASIFHLRGEIPNTEPPPSTVEDSPAIHPVKYFDASLLTFPRTGLPCFDPSPPPMRDLIPHSDHPITLLVTRVTSRMDTRRDLADTGASVSATGMRSILHNFTPQTSYDIMGYDSVVTKAAGQGIAHVYQAFTGTTEPIFFVYVPTIDGTIISLEHHARTHPRIHRWTQAATPTTHTGTATFYDSNDHIVSQYPTVMDKGLYYIQALDFVPVDSGDPSSQAHISTAITTATHDETDDHTVHTTNRTLSESTHCIDFDIPLHQSQVQDLVSWRYAWTFPLKSKSVSHHLLTNFLNTHGNNNLPNRRIRTDGEGSLSESVTFRALLSRLGYILQKTATDSSSQNGLAERPHQTLATMVRCLLYGASLPVTFWADALVYANYLNNRLYNLGTQKIPYTSWTGNRAQVQHLRAFGSHVSVKRSGNRPTKTDPHYYNGRFLRFGATDRNIVYFDPVTHRD